MIFLDKDYVFDVLSNFCLNKSFKSNISSKNPRLKFLAYNFSIYKLCITEMTLLEFHEKINL